MKAMNRAGKTWWLVDPWEHEEVLASVNAVVGHPLLRDGEPRFVGQMARAATSRSFTLSNPQASWLDAILRRCGQRPILGERT